MDKVILILADGMRPDALLQCGNGYVGELLQKSRYTMSAATVMPSVTLPCHMSLFHGVTPGRHGILTNTYVPQVRPVRGLFEVLRGAGKKCMMFYSWHELRDLARPDALAYSEFVSGHIYGYENAGPRLTADAIAAVRSEKPDFVFLYLGWPDAAGHGSGWMGEAYMESLRGSVDSVKQVIESIPDDYLVIFTADHGGHDRTHGTELPEDMTIPLILYNRKFSGEPLEKASILDIASTVTKVLGVAPDSEWEGTSLL